MQSANENYTLIRSVYLSINIYLTFTTSYIKIEKKPNEIHQNMLNKKNKKEINK